MCDERNRDSSPFTLDFRDLKEGETRDEAGDPLIDCGASYLCRLLLQFSRLHFPAKPLEDKNEPAS